MATTAKQIFVNFPVKDLTKTITFFKAIGFEFNPQFTDENAGCLVIGDNIFAMLLTESFYNTFTSKKIVDATQNSEVILAISAESREAVDELVGKALEAGGTPFNDKMDHGFMYTWSFQDLDGHLWEVMYMDPNAVMPEQA